MSDPIRQEYSDNLAWFKEHYHMLKEEHKGKMCLVIDGEGEIFGDIRRILLYSTSDTLIIFQTT